MGLNTFWEHPCTVAKDRKIYERGLLGVACSREVLKDNLRNRAEDETSFMKYFTSFRFDVVKADPGKMYFGLYNQAYYPDSGREIVEASSSINDRVSLEQASRRVRRNLAYQVLRKRASHGCELEIEKTDDRITMRVVPIVLDHAY